MQAIELYPNPGTLNDVVGLQQSKLFTIEVNQKQAFVYHGSEPEFNKYGFAKKGGHYLGFAVDEAEQVEISISTSESLDRYEVLPGDAIEHRTEGSQIHLRWRGVKKCLLKVWMDEEEQWLILSADPVETDVPKKEDKSVCYLDAGVHQKGRAWDPFVNGVNTLYLAPGAVLQATIRSIEKEGVSIRGRGIFAQAKWENGKVLSKLKAEWMADMMGMHFRDCVNVTVEGITVLNCPSYQLEFADCEQVHVNHVKLLGFGESNNDGMHLYGRHILVENSFIAGSDDRICLTGLFDREAFKVTDPSQLQQRLEDTDVYDLTIRNNLFWGQKNGGDIMITWNGGKTCESITIENCKSLGFTNKGFLAAKHGGSVSARDIVIRNIEIFHPRLVSLEVKEASCWGAGGGSIRDVLVENVTLRAEPEEVDLMILGHSQHSNIDGITFRNVRANGSKIAALEDTAILTNAFVKNLMFE